MIERSCLNGDTWYMMVDPADKGTGEPAWFEPSWFDANRENAVQVSIPRSWQIIPGMERYEGTCWFYREINRQSIEDHLAKDRVIFLHFEGVNYHATVWINGMKIGSHEGGYLPFKFKLLRSLLRECLSRWKGDLVLAVRVDSTRRPEQIPEFSCDWFQWGGIYRDVYIDIQPRNRVVRCLVTPSVSTVCDGKIQEGSISVRILATFPGELGLSVEGLAQGDRFTTEKIISPKNWNAKSSGNLHECTTTVKMDGSLAWHPSQPALYHMQLASRDPEAGGGILYETRFGMRSLKVENAKIFLNGERLMLKGSSLHEEKYPVGRAYSREERRKDIRAMKELGFNFLRTAHYSHDESLLEVADEEGMLIGEEIPVYWNVDYSNHETQRLAAKMMRDLVHRDFNHPSVIWWSVGNEIPVARLDCQRFIKMLLDLTRSMDTSRFTVYVSKNYVYDPLRKHTDIILLNGYLGWYYASTKNWGFMVELVHASMPQKPLVISEFGAGAKLGHGRHEPLDEKYTEWKQASIVSHAIKVFNSKPFIDGWVIWIYRDFKSHMRLNQFQQGYNRKGLVDEKGRKKLLAAWMPVLSSEAYHHAPAASIGALLLAKILWPLMAFIGILVDAFSPIFARKRNQGYYTTEAHPQVERKT
ncbi:hypothetical protein GF325_11250 [Candidatus Bathyarchaeota archaeon]|nr:hypothetical protein [Candidatus Bathyarchaeota archaeon]